MITVERYRQTRFWAVYDAGELVCVTVYKKGAVAVKDRLEASHRGVVARGAMHWGVRIPRQRHINRFLRASRRQPGISIDLKGD